MSTGEMILHGVGWGLAIIEPSPFGEAAMGWITAARTGVAATNIVLQINENDEGGSCPIKEPTPSTDPDDFDPWRKAKKNKKTGEIWEKDPSRHGGEHYEVYKNKKLYEKGVRNRAVWNNGKLKQKW